MLTIINALLPIFIVILLGYSLKHYKMLTKGFWDSSEKLTYYILLPALLFKSIATSSFSNMESYIPLYAICTAAITAIILIIILAYKTKLLTPQNTASITLGSTYGNIAYIGIPASLALFANEGMVIYALLIAIMVPLLNVITIIVLTILSDANTSLKTVLKKSFLHPIVVACILGLFINQTQLALPSAISELFNILGNAAMPFGLLVVGGALDIKSTKASFKLITVTASFKLIGLPLLAITSCKLLGINGLLANITVLYTTLPAAAATYILAKQLFGNAPLMAGIIVSETIMAAISMPIILYIAKTIFPY